MSVEGMAMWICRRCAAHVKDEILACPCCAMPAPARLQPELANHVSDEMNEDPRRSQIQWLTQKALPNLRKRAQSPWTWALFGFVFGLGCGVINFHGSLAQPFLCGAALAIVFGLLGAVLRWRLSKGLYAVEMGAIFGFFIPLIFAVIDAFTNYRGSESLRHLGSIILLATAIGVVLAVMGAIASGIVAPAVKILAGPLARRLGFKSAADKNPLRATLTKTDVLDRLESPVEMKHSDKITSGTEEVLSEFDAPSR